jgi:pimeloyl-ACP methyl ester carboxylesterase
MDELRALLEQAPTLRELVVVPGAGHWVPYEAAEATNRALLRLLG